jgi:uncharacterized protein YceH (UPF0502 family)
VWRVSKVGVVPDLPVLDPEEQRVLGGLLEKQVTVPASYPLSLNSLRTACNQSSSRDPVTDYDEQAVEQTARRLKDRGLARIVWSDTGRRTLKYHQTLDEQLELAEDERALVTVLLLRGPQAPGELKSRTERLHAFTDRGVVEETLRRMAERGLVQELPRRGGDRDSRWAHLLGDPPESAVPVAAAPAVDRESVLAEGGDARDARVRTSYDAVASTYADNLVNEVSGLPFERWLLDRVAEHAAGAPVVEVGCGPGHVTAYLAEAGADATGIDLSPGMIAEARRRFPEGTYEVGDLRQLMRPTTAPGWSAVLGWYSLIHLAASELPDAIGALARPLAPGGWLVLGMHAGTAVRHNDTWFDVPIDLDFVFNEPEDVVALVEAAGLVDIEWYRRGPLTHRGETTNRLYVIARKQV